MENEDNVSGQEVLDNKSAYAGYVSPDPEIDIETLGDAAGLSVPLGKPLSIAADFYERDQNRYELDFDSQETEASSFELDTSDLEDIEIVTTETGQIEGIHTQPVESTAWPDDIEDDIDVDDIDDETTIDNDF
jgi:hypothetical protein